MTDLNWVFLFGGAAALVFTVIYLLRDNLNVTYARVYGLITVAVLGVGLAFAPVVDDAKTAAFTLLGVIAGYLAGATPTTETETTESGRPETHTFL